MIKTVDIVILPPDNVMDLAIADCKQAFDNHTTTIQLNKTSVLPHISLLMGVLDEEKLGSVVETIQKIALETPELLLNAKKLDFGWFMVKPYTELQDLHERLVNSIAPFLNHENVTAEMYHPNQRNELSNDFEYWVKHYVNNHSFDKFDPHITTFLHSKENTEEPVSFVADRLALCHLGYGNTCRDILFETTLSSHASSS